MLSSTFTFCVATRPGSECPFSPSFFTLFIGSGLAGTHQHLLPLLRKCRFPPSLQCAKSTEPTFPFYKSDHGSSSGLSQLYQTMVLASMPISSQLQLLPFLFTIHSTHQSQACFPVYQTSICLLIPNHTHH